MSDHRLDGLIAERDALKAEVERVRRLTSALATAARAAPAGWDDEPGAIWTSAAMMDAVQAIVADVEADHE